MGFEAYFGQRVRRALLCGAGERACDLLVGAYLSNVNGANSGAAYLVFGKASGFGSSLSLGALDN